MEIVRRNRVANQFQLARGLRRAGFVVDQSLVSRDLRELGIFKLNGYYDFPRPREADAGKSEVTDIATAGDTILVVKTRVGSAQAVALTIDRRAFPEIVGTVAGDDTIFVAVKGKRQQQAAVKKIIGLFGSEHRT